MTWNGVRQWLQAYPRVRGDHLSNYLLNSGAEGLPPRARGSRRVTGLETHRVRPTPACAGITYPATRS